MPESTSSHLPRDHPDAATAQVSRHSTASSSSTSELAHLKIRLHQSLRLFPDFPIPGVPFVDILPLFANPQLHKDLIRALELHLVNSYGEHRKPDIVVGLDARGFLFGPSLALRLGAGFVPIRKKGKLPGLTETAGFKKEYGEDFFQIQKDGIKPGQRVVVVDDIIATGGSAAAAGSLVRKLGGTLLGYMFVLELDSLKGRDKLDAPIYTLLSSQEQGANIT